ncbi:MAG: two-partner secretion domain-containing protein, partial [Planctomycetota bacterium]
MNLLRTSSQKRLFRSVIVYFLTFCMFFNASLPVVLAGPEGAQVVNGDVAIQQSGYNTTITASDKAIINYSSFDIARPEIVQFIQPDTSASVLNRILSANPTNINGTLLANGRVFFVNPAGVYFGNGAQVNVNQLVASALNITDADFINGRYNFVGGEGSVINEGDIFAEKVYLIGRQVANSGSISCPAGYVVMASGDRVFLGEPGSDIVLEIEGPSLPESADPIEGSGVLNEGTVEAAGGTIVLAAAGDIYSQAISNVGSLSVSNDTGNAGGIKLTTADGDVTNTGTIEASGSEGGQIAMEGTRVGQFGTIHADGTESHGGNVDLMASDVVALSSGSLTTANAGTNGDGGEVIVYSPDTALFRDGAKIEVKGGSESGNGGFVEVSGREHVEVYGIADRTAVNGESGMLLIDPANIAITDNGVDDTTWTGEDFAPTNPAGSPSQIDIDTLETHLDSGDTTITTTWDDQGDSITNPDPGEAGNVTFNANRDLKDGVAGGSNNSLTINADGSIIFMANSGINFTGSGDVTLNVGSGGSVDLDADISLGGGTLSGNAATVNVQSNAAQIQDGINVAATGAAINVAAGTYTESVTVDEEVSVIGVGDTTIIQPVVDADGITITADNVLIKDLKVSTSNSG